MTLCSEAGPLGATVHHPGHAVAYRLGDSVIPTWLGDGLRANDDARIAAFYQANLVPVTQAEWDASLEALR